MSKIPAGKLQQLMGLDEYELTLAIDRVANELGISSQEVQAELDSVEPDSSANKINPPITKPTTNMIRVGFPLGSIGITQSAVTSAMVSKIYIKAARTEIIVVNKYRNIGVTIFK